MFSKKYKLLVWRKIKDGIQFIAYLHPPPSDNSLFQISAAPPCFLLHFVRSRNDGEGMKSHSVVKPIKTTSSKWNTVPLKYLLFISTIVIFASCQKVIDVNIKNADKKFVVEAVVTDKTGDSRVLLTTTKNVSENNSFPGVSGAVVTITDQSGNLTLFTDSAAGIYTAPGFTGETGKAYSLQVKINGETFTAFSRMPSKINLDTLFVSDEILFGQKTKLLNIAYQDPPGKGQNYRYVQYINGKKSKLIFVNNDDYSDGKYVESRLWYIADDDDAEDEKIKSGDTVMLDMLCIEEAVYKYWYSLNQSATGNSQSASPANAVSNISGGALGYFSAHTLQTSSVVAP